MELMNNHWMIFGVMFTSVIILDVILSLGKEPSAKAAIFQTIGYIVLGLLFGLYVYINLGEDAGTKWWTGFTLEYALSVDNLFVIGIIMTAFSIPTKKQRTLLYCGIAGAVIFRAIFIIGGATLVNKFWWSLPLMGMLLLYSGYKILFMHGDDEDEEEPALVQWVKNKKIPVFFGALFAIELTDIIFAVDSVPAILAVSTDPFIAFTASMCAVLGLRSLYFCVQAMKEAFHHLPKAIGLVLIFIGIKIILPSLHIMSDSIPHMHVPTLLSLVITVGTLAGGIVASIVFPPKSEKD
jgi:tellurite resistance protein TerC